MRTVLVIATALLVASASASNMRPFMFLLEDSYSLCDAVWPDGNVSSLSAVAEILNTSVELVDTDTGFPHSFVVNINPCQPGTFSVGLAATCNETVYAAINDINDLTCKGAMTFTNATNTTLVDSTWVRRSFTSGYKMVTVSWMCDSKVNGSVFLNGTVQGRLSQLSFYNLYFASHEVCQHATQAPPPSPEDKDDKLSTGVIIAIVIGGVVALSILGVIFTRCRASAPAEGEYNRV